LAEFHYGKPDEFPPSRGKNRRKISTGAQPGLLDRLTHRCQIFEMNSESFRFRESMKNKKGKKTSDES
jgi:hypothetical protein